MSLVALTQNESAKIDAALQDVFGGKRARAVAAIKDWRVCPIDGLVRTGDGALVLPREAKLVAILYAILQEVAGLEWANVEGAGESDADAAGDGAVEGTEPALRRRTTIDAALAAAGFYA